MMILAFTGTRDGMTAAQLAALPWAIATLPAVFLHGGAVGADTEIDEFMILARVGTTCRIEVYPSSVARGSHWAAKSGSRIVHPWQPPLVRNRIMADRCDALLACPATVREVLRSGTWATIRNARQAGKPITIIEPDGTITEERW